jgi:hypothetical protein
MSRNTRKKIGLRGGSVPYLNSNKLGIHNGRELKENMELYTISAHGQTTRDNRFIVVPEGAYFMFTAHSGVTAPGNDPGELAYTTYKTNRESFYDQLYTQIFKKHEDKKASGLTQYEEDLYIYEPGDVLPDYLLSFQNAMTFMFRHGVYKLPVDILSGEGKKGYSYIGKPLKYIKEQLELGNLSESDLDDLGDEFKQKVRNLTGEQLQSREGIPWIRGWQNSKLFNKIETLCCRGEDNLLFKPPFNLEQFKENKYTIRLSTILKLLEYEGKKYKFFFMSYCRVSLDDMLSGFSEKSLEIPVMLRTLSFSGKCPMSDDSNAFNLLKIKNIFCNFPDKIKAYMLKHPEIRSLISIIKKGVYPKNGNFNDWKDCLKDIYTILDDKDRFELVSHYQGYLTLEDIKSLIELYTFSLKQNKYEISRMEKAKSKIKDTNKIEEKKKHSQAAKFFSELSNAYADLGAPCYSLYKHFKKINMELSKTQKDKIMLMKQIYKTISDIMRPVPISPPRDNQDYLQLISKDIEELKLFIEVLKDESTINNLKEMRDEYIKYRNEESQRFSNQANLIGIEADWDIENILDEIKFYFILFQGGTPLYKSIEDFQIAEITDNSISFEDLESNINNTNNVINSKNVNKLISNLGNLRIEKGGRRKTKKKNHRLK